MGAPSAEPENIYKLMLTYQCRFPSKAHPKMVEAGGRNRDYLGRNWPWSSEEAKAAFMCSNNEDVMAHTIPGASDDLLEIVCLWATYRLLIDDILESDAGHIERFMTLLPLALGKVQPDHADPLQVITHTIHHRCRTSGGPVATRLFQHVNEASAKWVKFVVESRQCAEQQSYKTLDDFMEYRKREIGGFLMWAVVRWVCIIDLPQAILDHPDVQTLEDIATTYFIFINDIYSFEKEEAETQKMAAVGVEHVSPNTVATAIRLNGWTIHEVVAYIQSRLTGLEDQFLEVEQSAKVSINEIYGKEHEVTLDRYIDALKLSMAGNITWSRTCGRYNKLVKE